MRQLEALSTHHAMPCLEWSKQLSRETQPYFVATALPNIRQSYNAEPPRRHTASVSFDSMPLGHEEQSTSVDIRSYDPKLLDELHPKCGVNIGKSAGHGDTFAKPCHECEAVLEVDKHPGWGLGKKSDWAKAPKVSSFVKQVDRSLSPREESSPSRSRVMASPADQSVGGTAAPTLGGGKTSPAADNALFVQPAKKKERPALKLFACVGDTMIGGVIPRAVSRTEDHAPDLATLDVKVVQRYTPTLAFQKSSSRTRKEKPSEQYRKLLRPAPSPSPSSSMYSSTPSSSSMCRGFAPMRYNHRLTLKDLLGQTACDAARAQSVMESCFGKRSRSSLRNDVLYTPQPDSEPREL